MVDRISLQPPARLTGRQTQPQVPEGVLRDLVNNGAVVVFLDASTLADVGEDPEVWPLLVADDRAVERFAVRDSGSRWVDATCVWG